MNRAKILIVDDEENIRRTMKGSLEDEGYEVFDTGDGMEAIDMVRSINPDLVFLDIWLPGMDGMKALKVIKEFNGKLPVVIITGHGTVDTAMQAIKLGALDFLEKPLSLENILLVASDAIVRSKSTEKIIKPEDAAFSEDRIIGESIKTRRVREEIKKLSQHNKDILILGESGTGKELVARIIHRSGGESQGKMIKLNCKVFQAPELQEELFGKSEVKFPQKGPKKQGLLNRANKSTLFIDSIEEMELTTQKKVFEFIKRGKGPRIVAASSKNLAKEIEAGNFYPDLFDHFKDNIIELPPLRERKGDIPYLIKFFMEEFSKERNQKVKELEDEALAILVDFDWPENIKELKNVAERLIISVPTTRITLNDLPLFIRDEVATKRFRIYDKYTAFEDAEKAWKRNFIAFHLRKHEGDVALTAKKLKIKERTLKSYVKKFDILVEKKRKKNYQRTLKKSMVLSGRGLHSGLKTGLILSPLPPNSGILFGSISTGETIPAHLDYVESTEYATFLKKGKTYAMTIEHFMAVLHAYHISNLLIKINSEVPIMDGSALDFCRLIENAGIEEQNVVEEEIIIDKIYQIGDSSQSSKFISIEPAEKFSIKYILNYPLPVGKQEYYFVLEDANSFKDQIAPARTFGFLKDIETLEKKGLANGGRLNNFILIDDEKVINTELRFPDEFVRHKILDLIGDFYLLGRPIKGSVTAYMTGHSENNVLMKMVRDNLNIYW
jgi:two-component system nitrogen regulation response regulator NtrX